MRIERQKVLWKERVTGEETSFAICVTGPCEQCHSLVI